MINFSRLLHIALLAAASIIMCTPAAAQDKDTRTPLQAYEGAVLYGMMSCPLSLELANMQGTSDTPDTNWRACIEKAKAEAKVRYEAAAKTVKKPAAKTALKEHFITALSVLTAIAPAMDERKISYQQRQAANNDRLTDKWARFEVEN